MVIQLCPEEKDIIFNLAHRFLTTIISSSPPKKVIKAKAEKTKLGGFSFITTSSWGCGELTGSNPAYSTNKVLNNKRRINCYFVYSVYE